MRVANSDLLMQIVWEYDRRAIVGPALVQYAHQKTSKFDTNCSFPFFPPAEKGIIFTGLLAMLMNTTFIYFSTLIKK